MAWVSWKESSYNECQWERVSNQLPLALFREISNSKQPSQMVVCGCDPAGASHSAQSTLRHTMRTPWSKFSTHSSPIYQNLSPLY
jgi:hypothetical protein